MLLSSLDYFFSLPLPLVSRDCFDIGDFTWLMKKFGSFKSKPWSEIGGNFSWLRELMRSKTVFFLEL
jgi:hypothetical protein